MNTFKLSLNCVLIFLFIVSSCTTTNVGTKPNNPVYEPIEVYKETLANNEVKIYAKNYASTPYSVKLDLIVSNMTSSGFLTEPILIRPNSRILLTHLKAKGNGWYYNYTWRSKIGNYKARHNDEYVYSLPYFPNENFIMTQGYNGERTHQNKNAIDFQMPAGTRIRAMRDGKVIEIKEDSKTWCPTEECADYGNFIRIEHDDKSIAQYFHLMFESVEVEIGQQVEKGEFIGLSGNTGYSHIPHLHVEVLKPRFDNKPSGVETKFLTQYGIQFLIEGQSYIAQ